MKIQVAIRPQSLLPLSAIIALGWGLCAESKPEQPSEPSPPNPAAVEARPNTLKEARIRAQLLHSVFHGSLQVIHRDYFRRAQKMPIPSLVLQDVFKSLESDWNLKVRWLATNENAMNVDNQASDDFQLKAIKEIAAGKKEYEAVEGKRFRWAGSIPLQNQCLKCHAADRTSLEDRFSALEIGMDLDLPPAPAP